jgi:hypothetical protein
MGDSLPEILARLFGNRQEVVRHRFIPTPDSALHPDYQIERWKRELQEHTASLNENITNPTVSYVESMHVAAAIRILVCEHIDAWTYQITPKQDAAEIRSLMEAGIAAIQKVCDSGVVNYADRQEHVGRLLEYAIKRLEIFDELQNNNSPRDKKAAKLNEKQRALDGTELALAA